MFASPRFALRNRAIWLLGLVLIAGALAPAVSLAQSAGDQQYADPLAQQERRAPAPNSGAQGNSGSDNQGAGTAPSAQQAPTAPTQQDPNADAAQTAPSGTRAAAHRPRRGSDRHRRRRAVQRRAAPVLAGRAGAAVAAGASPSCCSTARRRRASRYLALTQAKDGLDAALGARAARM